VTPTDLEVFGDSWPEDSGNAKEQTSPLLVRGESAPDLISGVDTKANRVARMEPLKGHQSLTQRVADRIRDAILSREFPPGTRITEATLASRLGVSKTPVREALLRLQYIGVMEPDGPRGGRVVAASPKAILDAYQIREALESQAARLAATNATTKNIVDIRTASDRAMAAASAGLIEDFRQWDRRFHRTVALSAHNERLAEMIRDAVLLTWTVRRRDVPLADDSPECAKQHAIIADAIASGQSQSAAEAMSFHIAHVRDILVAAYPTKS
jgi:GntR family transcriptional regulator, rspAB operon transcriptional repressor